MVRVGVCEDEAAIRKVLSRALGAAGHEVVVAHDGGEALRLLSAPTDLDVILMDIGLPDADGRDVVQALQSGGQDAPVLFLTALGAAHERLAGFAAGADDYVVKPFEVKEVLARIDVLARRRRVARPAATGLVLDAVTHAVRGERGEVALTPTEFRMLAAILARPGEVVRRHAVVAAAWPDGAVVSENTVDSFLRKIRAKVASVSDSARIETVRGVGFTVKGHDGRG
ncbi:MAG: response regulator transcription factor [Aeromicrobium erythreum]